MRSRDAARGPSSSSVRLPSGRLLRSSAQAERRLLAHSWPGNVRELGNAIERAAVLARSEEIGEEVLSARAPSREARGDGTTGTLQESLDRAAAQRIREALHASGR